MKTKPTDGAIGLVLLLWALASTVQAQDYTYTNNAGSITITGYTGAGGAVVIPDTIEGLPVTVIGIQAFGGQTNLTSVTIPDSVTTIGDYAFYNCSGLTNIAVDAANPNYSSVDGVLFNKAQTMLIQCPGGKAGSYTMPDSFVTIGAGAFELCTGLTSATIGNNVMTIGYSAFYKCTSLTSVTIPDSVNNIRANAFYYCTSMTVVTIGNFVATIGDSAFYHCGSLTSVTIGSSVTTIGDSAFNYCTNLTSITIPDSVTTIGDRAFFNCTDLSSVYFMGNAPNFNDGSIFYQANNATVYYLPGTTGWEATFAGRPTVLWNPTPQISGPTDPFGFTITASSDLVIVVEAATNLSSPDWTPVSTNTLTDGSSLFSDPQWSNHPARFYRLRSP